MSVFTRIEKDFTDARRNRDAGRLKVLTLLISKIQRIAKDDGNRDVREDAADVKDGRNDVVAGINRYRKEVNDMRDAKIKAGRDTADEDAELAIVDAYLPRQMTAEELDAEIEKALEGTDCSSKAMGVVMKHLNGSFRGQFDPKSANAAVKAKLG